MDDPVVLILLIVLAALVVGLSLWWALARRQRGQTPDQHDAVRPSSGLPPIGGDQVGDRGAADVTGGETAAGRPTGGAPKRWAEPDDDAGQLRELGAEGEAETGVGAAARSEGLEAEARGLDAAAAPAATAEIETPEPATSRLRRLRERLAGSKSALGRALLAVLSRDQLTADDWDEFEEALLLADVGAAASEEILEAVREAMRVEGGAADARATLRRELLKAVATDAGRGVADQGEGGNPGVILVVGVNGSGKTTTIGRLARLEVAEGNTVVLGAADTFRAAAADQLATWGQRVGVEVVRGAEGADPASVAFDAVAHGIETAADTVIIDTAGRLHNKANLMEELGKIKRVAAKRAPITETLLVLDATTGQNALSQARVFTEVVDVTGIVLTKLDGTAKGGIVIAVQKELGVPVKLVGLGEGPDDLAPFDAEAFVDGLL
ncbi:MAG: signal recognition particle-docking protein FtsY [Bifidobacteriaceae bacterium]|jgi:fused signal recognition particle receptor|nr:signal recognition particle-docking protein FtsY [Bifidobacteriaceae bacterium]